MSDDDLHAAADDLCAAVAEGPAPDGYLNVLQLGMRAVLADIQEWLAENSRPAGGPANTGMVVDSNELRAFLRDCRRTAGGVDP